jgi:TolA-binding protein
MEIKVIEEKRKLMVSELGQLQTQLNAMQTRIQQLTGGVLLCNELIQEAANAETKEEKKDEENPKKDVPIKKD